MPDAMFADRRLAEVYDHIEDERDDLDVYAAMVDEFGARAVLDVGCGTGTLACALARRGLEIVAVDPAAASLDLARTKPGAEQVRWILGDATTLPPLRMDLAMMTGNVAQVFVTDHGWRDALLSIRAALSPGGRFVFETRDPTRRAWLGWDRTRTYAEITVPDIGLVATWTEVLDVDEAFVTFRSAFSFEPGDIEISSESRLRFRSRAEIEQSLIAAGYDVEDVRDAPDRPGMELVFVARLAEWSTATV